MWSRCGRSSNYIGRNTSVDAGRPDYKNLEPLRIQGRPEAEPMCWRNHTLRFCISALRLVSTESWWNFACSAFYRSSISRLESHLSIVTRCGYFFVRIHSIGIGILTTSYCFLGHFWIMLRKLHLSLIQNLMSQLWFYDLLSLRKKPKLQKAAQTISWNDKDV